MEYAIICRLEGMSRGRRISVAPSFCVIPQP